MATFRCDDFTSYVFVTNDYGKSWRKISDALTGYAHVVLEDPKEPNLIYVGTELGIVASFDRGLTWTDLRLGLPHLAVVDLKVHPRDNDLVIATHARGFYVLDDATPLQQLAHGVTRDTQTLFPPMRATRYTPASDTSVLGNRAWVARNKPYGAIISYLLPESAGGAATLTVTDASGRAVRTLEGTSRPGLNRVVWNLAEASACAGGQGRGGRGGRGRGGAGASWIRAMPGEYRVTLTAGGEARTTSLTVRLDPRVAATQEDLDAYYRAVTQIERIECATSEALAKIAAIESQIPGAVTKAPQIKVDADAVRGDLRAIAVELSGDPREPNHLNLRGKINWLTIQVGNYSGRPTSAQLDWIGRFAADSERLTGRLVSIVQGSLARLNEWLKSAGAAEIR